MALVFRIAGFSLAELLVAVAIVAITLSLAVPGLNSLFAQSMMRTAANELARAFHVARQHSLANGIDAAICPTADGAQCSNSSNWNTGWLVFSNRDGEHPPRVDSDEAILLYREGRSMLNISANRRAFVLRPFGLRSTNGTFLFCDRGQAVDARRLVVSYTGKPRLETMPGRRPVCDRS